MVEITEPLTREGIAELQSAALAAIAAANSPAESAPLRHRYLGRKGLLRRASLLLGKAPSSERPELGRLLNVARQEIQTALQKRSVAAPREKRPEFDFTLPGRPLPRGRLHPITQTIEAVKDIFMRLGFEVVYGPEVEVDYCNFEALNIPEDHPSRDAFDTFFLEEKRRAVEQETAGEGPSAPSSPVSCAPLSPLPSSPALRRFAPRALLRSQTSTVQIRVMENRKPPIRIIAPGKVYRPDTVDATHSFLFHQVEGLVVDEGVTMADLKYVLHEFARGFYGPDVRMRFRPSFFPFTEPSVEVDVSCFACGGDGCGICKGTGWIEVLGAGMVDPNVFQAVGYDAEKYTGFAFGMGVERVAMLRHGIDDIRLFLENDLRFLQQF